MQHTFCSLLKGQICSKRRKSIVSVWFIYHLFSHMLFSDGFAFSFSYFSLPLRLITNKSKYWQMLYIYFWQPQTDSSMMEVSLLTLRGQYQEVPSTEPRVRPTLSLTLSGEAEFGCCRIPLCFVPLISRWLLAQCAKADQAFVLSFQKRDWHEMGFAGLTARAGHGEGSRWTRRWWGCHLRHMGTLWGCSLD